MICISLAGLPFKKCKKKIGKAEFAEIRIDQLDLSENQLVTLFSLKKNTVATCRPGSIADERRLNLLKLAIDAGAAYIDIEYEAPEDYRSELITYAREKGALAILSYHNFEETPEKVVLEKIISDSETWGADRVKIATMANFTTDNARILALYEDHKNLIAFCMGKLGAITRVAAPFLGADFTYAAINRKLATAPGQLTVDEFADIYEIIN